MEELNAEELGIWKKMIGFLELLWGQRRRWVRVIGDRRDRRVEPISDWIASSSYVDEGCVTRDEVEVVGANVYNSERWWTEEILYVRNSLICNKAVPKLSFSIDVKTNNCATKLITTKMRHCGRDWQTDGSICWWKRVVLKYQVSGCLRYCWMRPVTGSSSVNCGQWLPCHMHDWWLTSCGRHCGSRGCIWWWWSLRLCWRKALEWGQCRYYDLGWVEKCQGQRVL